MKQKLSGIILLLSLAFTGAATALDISNLRVEYLAKPQGMHETSPRFSWELASERRAAGQSAFRIKVVSAGNIIWDSGKIKSSEIAQIAYDGKPLTSGIVCKWTVQVWDENGQEFSSTTASWSMGLPKESDWQAEWIGVPLPAPETGVIPEKAEPITLQKGTNFLKKTFSIKRLPERARLMVTGNQPFQIRLNVCHIKSIEPGGRPKISTNQGRGDPRNKRRGQDGSVAIPKIPDGDCTLVDHVALAGVS